ncbi:MAG TPA: hypothetical protein VMF03_19355 [Steroidobacteraceae bacterium]|nr:hypothetical protein [Steroidobacteraceae bacterium]
MTEQQAQAKAGPQWAPAVARARRELPGYLPQQRWYPAKDAELTGLTLEALQPLDTGARAALALWKLTVAGREPFELFVPLRDAPGEGFQDALADDDFVRALVGWMLERGRAPPGVQAGCTAHAARLRQAAPWSVSRSKAEQSNSSFRIADAAMLKVLRRIEAGIHPELEVGRFLTEQAHFSGTPALLGWIAIGERTLALLQAFIPNEGDGWNWIRAHLQAGTASEPQVMEWIAILGRRTAELHAAFRTATSDEAFRTERAGPEDWEHWTRAIGDSGRTLLQALERQAATLDPQARELAAQFRARAPRLDELLASLLRPLPHWEKTRHHGDYHLGQVLVRPDDAIIVDFEGEPLRPLSERRAKHVALRDVAGMLRSIDYAGASAEAPGGQEWSAAASRIFLDRYLERLQQLSPTPLDREAARRIVRLFQIEKALYEVAYELANRPAWAAIPLRGLLEALGEHPA